MPYKNTNLRPSLVVVSSFLLDRERVQISRAAASLEQQSPPKNKRRVRFGSLEIHEHVVQLGGATVPSSGAPLGMSWERQAYYELSLEDYEAFKTTPSRKGREMLRSRTQRVDLLLNLGYTMSAINRRSVECDEIRKQRMASAKPFPLRGLVQSVRKQLKRRVQPVGKQLKRCTRQPRSSSLLGVRACY
jgi:hypothetical protein